MKMNIFYFFAFILLSTLFSCSGGPANDPRSIYTYQTMQGEMFQSYYRVADYSSQIKEISLDRSTPEIQNWGINSLSKVDKIQKKVAEIIYLIEEAKRLMFLQMGENLDIDDPNSIRSSKYDYYNPIVAIGYDLSNVKNNETTNLLSPDGAFARKIQVKLKQLRELLTETEAYLKITDPNKTFYFVDPNINSFTTKSNLREQLEKSNALKNVALDDHEIVLRIYERLSYNQAFWDNCIQENVPWQEVFGFLISLEIDIYNATADAISGISCRVGCGGGYNIAEIVPIILGDEIVKAGKKAKFEIFLGGQLFINNPIVKAHGAKVISVKDGKAILTADMGKALEIQVTGTFTVLSKSGVPTTIPWKKTFFREPNK